MVRPAGFEPAKFGSGARSRVFSLLQSILGSPFFQWFKLTHFYSVLAWFSLFSFELLIFVDGGTLSRGVGACTCTVGKSRLLLLSLWHQKPPLQFQPVIKTNDLVPLLESCELIVHGLGRLFLLKMP